MQKTIYFPDKSHPRIGFLSNDSKNSFIYNERKWLSASHLIQSKKFEGTPLEAMIRDAPTSYIADLLSIPKNRTTRNQQGERMYDVYYGNSVQKYNIRSDWETYEPKIMKEAIICKFEQNPLLQKKLLETRNMKLIDLGNKYTGPILEDYRSVLQKRKLKIRSQEELYRSIMKDIDETDIDKYDNFARSFILLIDKISEAEGWNKIMKEMVEDAIIISTPEELKDFALDYSIKFSKISPNTLYEKLPIMNQFTIQIEDILMLKKTKDFAKHSGLISSYIKWIILESGEKYDEISKKIEFYNNDPTKIILPKIKRSYRSGLPPNIVPKGKTSSYVDSYELTKERVNLITSLFKSRYNNAKREAVISESKSLNDKLVSKYNRKLFSSEELNSYIDALYGLDLNSGEKYDIVFSFLGDHIELLAKENYTDFQINNIIKDFNFPNLEIPKEESVMPRVEKKKVEKTIEYDIEEEDSSTKQKEKKKTNIVQIGRGKGNVITKKKGKGRIDSILEDRDATLKELREEREKRKEFDAQIAIEEEEEEKRRKTLGDSNLIELDLTDEQRKKLRKKAVDELMENYRIEKESKLKKIVFIIMDYDENHHMINNYFGFDISDLLTKNNIEYEVVKKIDVTYTTRENLESESVKTKTIEHKGQKITVLKFRKGLLQELTRLLKSRQIDFKLLENGDKINGMAYKVYYSSISLEEVKNKDEVAAVEKELMIYNDIPWDILDSNPPIDFEILIMNNSEKKYCIQSPRNLIGLLSNEISLYDGHIDNPHRIFFDKEVSFDVIENMAIQNSLLSANKMNLYALRHTRNKFIDIIKSSYFLSKLAGKPFDTSYIVNYIKMLKCNFLLKSEIPENYTLNKGQHKIIISSTEKFEEEQDISLDNGVIKKKLTDIINRFYNVTMILAKEYDDYEKYVSFFNNFNPIDAPVEKIYEKLVKKIKKLYELKENYNFHKNMFFFLFQNDESEMKNIETKIKDYYEDSSDYELAELFEMYSLPSIRDKLSSLSNETYEKKKTMLLKHLIINEMKINGEKIINKAYILSK